VFLHVSMATAAHEVSPPKASYRLAKPGQIEVTVDSATATLTAPDWFREQAAQRD
jgi:hypothetical protein